MKKFIAMLCILTCILGLTGCGEEPTYTDFEKTKGENATIYAENVLLPYMLSFLDDGKMERFQDRYNAYEIAYITEKNFSDVTGDTINVDVQGNAITTGMVSFKNTSDSMGDIIIPEERFTGTGTYVISGDEIIVTIPVTGTKTDANGNARTAKAEFIFSNDLFYTVKSCALNLDQSMGELMGKAGLDTLMGMATVFSILILISLLIWAMGTIVPMLDGSKKKEKKQDIKEEAVNNTIAQIIEKEENEDDTELVAVIAAAIAAYEGSASTDGFVVRSIRRR